jgi:hypothetical protein
MVWIFQKSLDGAADLLIEQLEVVKAKGFAVQVSYNRPCQAKLSDLWSFSSCDKLSLLISSEESYPHRRLRAISCSENTSPKRACNREEFSGPRNSVRNSSHSVSQHPQPQSLRESCIILTNLKRSTAVARGAVLRAFNKEQGPLRNTSCSYGFLRTEPYEPEEFAAHKNARCIIDKTDGEKYIDGTIKWLIQKVCILYAYVKMSALSRPWLMLIIHSSRASLCHIIKSFLS